VLDEPYAVVIARVDAPHSTVRFTANLGKREHLHCSAVGKAMLAALPEATVLAILAAAGLPEKTTHTITEAPALHAELESVGERGYAIDDEEDNVGVFCVGSAIFDHSAHCVGAVSITGLKLDLPAWRVEQLGQTVRGHAERISTLLGAPARAEAAV
jgi:IclR family acetate operon transcriptional repressor